MSGNVSRISVSVDPELLKEFDEMTQRIGYNRSTAVQYAMRGFITEHKWKDLEGVLAGVITNGKIANGLKHSFIMVVAAWVVLRIVAGG
ncbi:MAG: hypothetical protein ACWGQW_22800 [bacterium]